MSKGNPMVGCRLPKEMYEEIRKLVEQSVYTKSGEPHTVASWLVQAAREKLAQKRRDAAYRINRRSRKATPPVALKITVADPGANV